jgi:large subunit ribosomal protein L23
MENIYGIIEKPIRTERSMILKEKGNRYVFRVRRTATKPEIKKAVEELFHVTVEKVRTMIFVGKFRRVSKSLGKKPDWKKAIVSVKEGQSIDIGEKS